MSEWTVRIKGLPPEMPSCVILEYFSKFGAISHLHYLPGGAETVVLYPNKTIAASAAAEMQVGEEPVEWDWKNPGLCSIVERCEALSYSVSFSIIIAYICPALTDKVMTTAYSSSENWKKLFDLLDRFKDIGVSEFEKFLDHATQMRGEPNIKNSDVARLLLDLTSKLPENAIHFSRTDAFVCWKKTLSLLANGKMSMDRDYFADTCTDDLLSMMDSFVVKGKRRRTWERRMQTAKERHRPRLTKANNWGRDRFYDKRRDEFLSLRTQDSAVVDVEVPTNLAHSSEESRPYEALNAIDRISCRNLTYAQFVERYERPKIPVLISNIPDCEKWSAISNWNTVLLKKYGKRMFKCGEDDDGYKVKIKLKYFLKYMKENTDDSPLYIFDSAFDDDPVSKSLLEDFSPPSYFPEDLFELVGEKRRPPYRWFLVGPMRSGTCVHIDPLGTSAWNTVLQGRKRWVIFPPETTKSVAKALDVIKKGEDDEAIHYFVDFIPRLRKLGHHMIEFTQYPGDTVFIPGGWWHAVLNLDDTIAITQNFCSSANLPDVWRKTRTGRKKMSIKWQRLLGEKYPELARVIDRVDEEDSFVREELSSSKKHKKEQKLETQGKKQKKEKPEFKRSSMVQNGYGK